MAKVTRTVSRACAGKKRHRTEAAAAAHRLRLIQAGAFAGALKAYPCPVGCGGWHVGHREHRKHGGRRG